jgi:ribosomal protein S12 methylthiotransferase accessory factor
MEIEVSFPGGVAVDAQVGGFTVHTDQPKDAGGADSGPSPFAVFLASLAACAGFYALRFCQVRGIDTTGLGLGLRAERQDGHGRLARVRIEIRLPPGFPEKYRDAVVRAVDACAVKRAINEPPEFETVVG